MALDHENTSADATTATPEMNVSISSLSGLPDIGANTEIFGASENINIDEYAKDLDPTALDDIGRIISLSPTPDSKSDLTSLTKPQKARIYINDYSENEGVGMILKEEPLSNMNEMPINLTTVASNMKSDALHFNPIALNVKEDQSDAKAACDIEDLSDDDFDDDLPCGMDELTLPNSNTDRNATDKLKSSCSLCSYNAVRGWKQLIKHYVRKHPGSEISISRLSKQFNSQELMVNPLTPLITKKAGESMISSLCYICNEGYNMCSSKWLMHFISHTGNYRLLFTKIARHELFDDLYIFFHANFR